MFCVFMRDCFVSASAAGRRATRVAGRICRCYVPRASRSAQPVSPSASAPNHMRLSADVGGTFTDVAAFDEATGELRLGKTLTTPTRLVDGVETGVTKAGTAFKAAKLFLHGTTIAINTLLERTGAR